MKRTTRKVRQKTRRITSNGLVRAKWASLFRAKAEKNIAKWGLQDTETLCLAIMEEAGELAQAVLQHKHEGKPAYRITEEAADLGALCLQVWAFMDRPPCAACDRSDFQLGHSDDCPNNPADFARVRERKIQPVVGDASEKTK